MVSGGGREGTPAGAGVPPLLIGGDRSLCDGVYSTLIRTNGQLVGTMNVLKSDGNSTPSIPCKIPFEAIRSG